MPAPKKAITTEVLTQIQQSLQGINNINTGGCAVFAALVGRELEKAGVKPKIIVLAPGYWIDKGKDLSKLSKQQFTSKSQWDKQGVSFYHVVVEVSTDKGKVHFDSDTMAKASRKKSLWGLPAYKGNLNVRDCVMIARRASGWNYMFDRKQIPVMKKRIKEVFSAGNALAQLT